MRLKGKTAFVTGFGSGLGQAIAVMFAKEGAAVAGTSPREMKGRETVALVERVGGKALYWPGDVADSARNVETATILVRALWRTLLAPVVPWAFALVTLMGAACAVFGTALNHLVFGRAFR